MFEITKNMHSVSFIFSSDMVLVDRVVEECGPCLKYFGMPASFQFKLVLRELLINAVEHGNRMIYKQLVTCRIECCDKKEFKIMVEDEGAGFDYGAINMELPEDPLQERNRGYALVNAFSDRLEFNTAGNQIIAYVGADLDED